MSRIDAPRHSLDFPAGFTLLDANAFVLQLSAVLVIVNDNARAEDYQRVSLLGVCIRFARICTFTALGLTNICTRSAAGEIEKITVVRRECYVTRREMRASFHSIARRAGKYDYSNQPLNSIASDRHASRNHL